jgi:NADPH:quinone reductase-like Zn-dependent oxidoreductase
MPERMQAAVLQAPSKLVIREIPVPEPTDRDLLVRVAAVGLNTARLVTHTSAFTTRSTESLDCRVLGRSLSPYRP